METTNLDKYLSMLKRIEEHREDSAVKDLKKLYKRLLKDLRAQLGDMYANYADENGLLTYAQLHKNALDARLLQEVQSRMNDVTLAEQRLITETVEQTYSNVYSGMVQAVEKAVDNQDLASTFASVRSVKPQALRAAVNNPIHGLSLPAQLERNRANIIYGIKQAVGIGLSVGDRFDTMAKRVQKALIGDNGTGGSYAKSVRIVRTEAHRVREQGNHDAASDLASKIAPAGFEIVKVWHTMKDERVRPNSVRKTKKGWKHTSNGQYNHVKMEGQSVPVNEPFQLPSGATAMSPGMSGVAGEDINCRCFVSYEVRKTAKALNDSTNDAILTLDEEGAIASYTSFESYMLNDTLRNGRELDERYEKIAKNLDSALLKLPKYKGNLIRDLSFKDFPDSEERTQEFLSEFTVGKDKTFPEFLSTTSNSSYSDNPSVRIFINHARNGRDLRKYNQNESEILYQRGSRFNILSKRFINGIYCIELEEAT